MDLFPAMESYMYLLGQIYTIAHVNICNLQRLGGGSTVALRTYINLAGGILMYG